MEFPKEIKDAIHSIILGGVEEFSSLDDESDLLEGHFHFFSENKGTKKVEKAIFKFVNQSEVEPIARANIKFCFSSTSFCKDGSSELTSGNDGRGILNIFDDFILMTLRLILNNQDDAEKIFETQWKKFEEDFFSEKVEIRFYAQISNFFHNTGGILEELIPSGEAKIRYLNESEDDRFIFHAIRQSIKDFGSIYMPNLADEFSSSTPRIMQCILKIDKSDNIFNCLNKVYQIFEKITFVIRVISGGSVHFDFIRPFFLGNNCDCMFIRVFPPNHLFSNCQNTTNLHQCDDIWIQRLWKSIENRDFAIWQFSNFKLRDSYMRTQDDSLGRFVDNNFKLNRFLERTVDLAQIIENIVGDFGYSNAEYVGKLISKGDTGREKEISECVGNLILLRNKFLHGKPSELEQVFASKFNNNLENLEQELNKFEYYAKQTIILSIMNNDLTQKMEAYHQSLGRKLIRPGTPNTKRTNASIQFPTFNTIYYS